MIYYQITTLIHYKHYPIGQIEKRYFLLKKDGVYRPFNFYYLTNLILQQQLVCFDIFRKQLRMGYKLLLQKQLQ